MTAPSSPSMTATPGEGWTEIERHALGLAAALHRFGPGQPPPIQAACDAYSSLVDEIARWASAQGAQVPSSRPAAALTRKQLQDFGRLLRDKRNQAGLSRVQLGQKAKLSDATIKFAETARHPPSRATLLRLVAVSELGLCWADTPGYAGGAVPADSAAPPLARLDAEFSRFDSRLTLLLVLESLLVLDELRASLHAVEVTTYGARRVCCLCGARSEAWALDAREAVKLPLQHAVPCAGRLAEALWQRAPWLSELALQERRSLCSPTATALQASLGAIHREQFYGCRSRTELAAQLARGAGLAPTAFRAEVSAMLLWAVGLGPCPVEPTQTPFSEHEAQQLAQVLRTRGLAELGDDSQLRGVSEAAAWLIDPQAPEPEEPSSPAHSAARGRQALPPRPEAHRHED